MTIINEDVVNNIIIDIKLLKIVGLYQIISMKTVKLFGYNFVRSIFVIPIVVFLMTATSAFLNFYYYTNDIFGAVNYNR